MLGTPRRTVVAGIAALVLATILLLVYLNHYRISVKSANATVPVLAREGLHPRRARRRIDRSRRRACSRSTSIPKDQLKEGAVTDAGVLHGQVALNDIYPGSSSTADRLRRHRDEQRALRLGRSARHRHEDRHVARDRDRPSTRRTASSRRRRPATTSTSTSRWTAAWVC